MSVLSTDLQDQYSHWLAEADEEEWKPAPLPDPNPEADRVFWGRLQAFMLNYEIHHKLWRVTNQNPASKNKY